MAGFARHFFARHPDGMRQIRATSLGPEQQKVFASIFKKNGFLSYEMKKLLAAATSFAMNSRAT